MKTKIISYITLLIILTSCTVAKKYTNKTQKIEGLIIHKPVIVDLDVSEKKITGTDISSTDIDITISENAAVADALKKADADVLVEPRFETETKAGLRTTTVVGRPAQYKNFRPIKAEDIPLLEVNPTSKAHVYEPVESSKAEHDSSSRRARIVILVVALAVIFIGLIASLGKK